MFNLDKIVYKALVSTSKHYSWWILAFFQAGLLFFAGRFLKPHFLLNYKSIFLFTAVVVLQPICLWLWLEITASYENVEIKTNQNKFWQTCFRLFVICAVSIIICSVPRFFYLNWVSLSLFSSAVSSTTLLSMLYCSLNRQGVKNSTLLAFDTWRKNVSLAVVFTVFLIICHGVSFVIIHTTAASFELARGFSDFNHSATIWLLLLVLAVFIAYFGAVLNYIVIALFLESIKPIKQKKPSLEFSIALPEVKI
jgi:hypothetical protein